ncbi:MAG TPA: bifunctional metallophosphatase/5'-nucleotidase [Bacteroidia bacterium]|nr:bifunctional metallophosphatase/5'-nucleotidase [Bacteroidia bacterium]
MSENKCNHTEGKCSCSHEEIKNEVEQKKQHDYSRRDFIRYGSMGLIGAKISPALSYWLQDDGKIKEMLGNKAVIDGKAKHFTILHTADIHAQLDTHPEFFWENNKDIYRNRGGFATLKTMLNELRKQNPGNTLLVDGGDCFQGSAVASLTEGQAIVPLMNNIKYDLVLPGNWEVIYKKKMLLKDMNMYTAKKICANMFDSEDEKHELLFPPYQIFTLGGVKIGFVGYNDPLTPIRQSPGYSKGIKFTKPEQDLASYVKLLKEDNKCDMVFVVSHMGMAQQLYLSNQDYANGVDYVLGADTHERIRTPIQGKYSKVTEPGAFASFVGKLDIIIEDGKIKDEVYQLIDVDPEKYKADEEMLKQVEEAKAPYKKDLVKVIGKTTTPLMRYFTLESPMDNMITDALREKAKTDIAISNGFRFCHPIVPDEKTGVADITVDHMWSMLPVNSAIHTGDATGKQIMTWLEDELDKTFSPDATRRFGGWLVRFSGMKINFTIASERGKRVNSVTIGDKPLDMDKLYSVCACERDGDPDDTICRITNVQHAQETGILLHDIMKEYLAAHSPVSYKIEGRAVATDAPSTLLTQIIPGVDYQFR